MADIAYKVVRVKPESGKRYSTNHSFTFNLEYKVGEKTLPVEDSYLYVFDDANFALCFANTLLDTSNIEIWECEAEFVDEKCMSVGRIDDFATTFWKTVKTLKEELKLSYFQIISSFWESYRQTLYYSPDGSKYSKYVILKRKMTVLHEGFLHFKDEICS